LDVSHRVRLEAFYAAFLISLSSGSLAAYDAVESACLFENEWQSFRTRQNRDLELTTASHTYEKPGRYIIAVKVIDIFGNDTMTLVPVTVG
jgi:hypothetical protein